MYVSSTFCSSPSLDRVIRPLLVASLLFHHFLNDEKTK